MLRVYYCRLPEKEIAVPDVLLSAYRTEKLKKQTNAQVRLRSLCSELLLRYALKDSGFLPDGPLDIAAGENGKPFLKSGACFFSLSHSADALLCALCGKEIGADIQQKTPAQSAVIKRFFTAQEQAYICDAPDPDAAFTEIWTKKESRCKQDGRGLALSPGSFCVFDAVLAPLFWHRTAGDYHLAVCSEAVMTEQVELIEIETSALLP